MCYNDIVKFVHPFSGTVGILWTSDKSNIPRNTNLYELTEDEYMYLKGKKSIRFITLLLACLMAASCGESGSNDPDATANGGS